MLADDHPDRIQIAFDDHRVANAGLILPATLGRHLGLPELVDRHLDLGRAPGRANTGDKVMTLVASALAGGDCIDDADVLRTGGTAGAIGCVVKAPSTLGTFCAGGAMSASWIGSAGSAGPGLVGWGRTRRRAPDHRPGLHHLRGGQGGSPPRLHRPARLSPDCRRNRRRADGSAAQGPRQHRSGRRSLSTRDGGANATAGPGDNSRCGLTAASTPTPSSPSAARWMCATPSPSASTPACIIEAIPEMDADTGWTAPPTWRRP